MQILKKYNYFCACQANNQHFPGIVMGVSEEPSAQSGGCVRAACPGVQHTHRKKKEGKNNKEKSF